jgi:hypothetical protein
MVLGSLALLYALFPVPSKRRMTGFAGSHKSFALVGGLLLTLGFLNMALFLVLQG